MARMEGLFRLLPGPQPLWLRYGAATLMVLVAMGARYGLQEYTGRYGFLPFILPIVGSALLFDRGTGIYATVLSALCVAVFLDWERDVPLYIGALTMFFVVSGCLVFIAEGLHRALVAAHNAQRAADLLLQEMTHRVKNKFAMVSSIIALQARQSTPEVQRALDDVSQRVNVIANVHNFLQLSRHEGLIDMSEYLPALGNSLQDALGGPRNISVAARAESIQLPPEKALSVGVIVNELVTNSLKYAFTDGRSGAVKVSLIQQTTQLELSVLDDGKGCPADMISGLGTRLVSVFATQLGGEARWEQPEGGGCRVAISFPS